jgi:hypothetical protein
VICSFDYGKSLLKLEIILEKSNFTILKRILYILILLFSINLGASAQVAAEDDPANKFIHFYPNPAVSSINLEFQHDYSKDYTIEIYNFIGKKIMDFKPAGSRINVPLTDFYRGIYIYQLRDRMGKILESGKFQVIK